jgi:hypothetical protein
MPTERPTIAPVGLSWILTSGNVQGLVLTVTFSWLSTQKDLDSGIVFLGFAQRVNCNPKSNKYLTFSGDNLGYGGKETHTIALGSAFEDSKWNGSTTIQMRSSWSFDTGNQGEATVTMFTSRFIANGTTIYDNNAISFDISPSVRQANQCSSVISNITVVRDSYGQVIVIIPK